MSFRQTNNIYKILLVLFLLSSCASVEKYNQQISKKHSPKKLRKDVDYAYKKLQELHPDLYWYISKDELEKKFEDLKDNLQKPLTGKDFYIQLAPVIAAIKQGHTRTFPPRKSKTKAEKKSKLKKNNPFKPLRLQLLDNKLFITKNFGRDSTIVIGSQLIRVENESVKNLLPLLQKLNTSDGYNQTFLPKFTGLAFGSLYMATHKNRDSLLITLKNRDSIYQKYLYAIHKKQYKEQNKKDSLKKKLTRIERKLLKKKKKERFKWEWKYGYDKYTKEKTRDFKFFTPDSLHTVSYLKIRGFKKGNFKNFYKESFAKIDSAQSSNLIIDLRDNLGGRLDEIDNLYSYLVTKEYLFIKEAKMTKARSFIYPSMHSKSWFTKAVTTLLYPGLLIYQGIKVKKVNGKPNFQFPTSKLKEPKTNNYKGKIYVLINGTSFSASAVISNHLKATKRATFVGEETGGAYNGTVAGLFANIELPNSKVKMKIGLMSLRTPYTVEPDGFGVKPDVYIKTTRLDKDEQLEWVLDEIVNKP